MVANRPNKLAGCANAEKIEFIITMSRLLQITQFINFTKDYLNSNNYFIRRKA